VVWTHTEREYLAALFLWWLRPPTPRPKLAAQSLWLFDRWDSLSRGRRWLYRKLVSGADVMITLSPDNLREAKRLFPGTRCELARFGVDPECVVAAKRKTIHGPIRILSLGTDMHRDWETLFAAVGEWSGAELRIASGSMRERSLPANASLHRPRTASEVRELYSWADLVVIALKPNLHASGITVVAEAVSLGIPVVCTDTGGLRSYFDDCEISYVIPHDAGDLRGKIEELAADDGRRFAMAARAQQRLMAEDLTSHGYALRYREISESLFSPTADSAGETLSYSRNRYRSQVYSL
jgi:glycosyltransferase involved in cell wall biosynthesis